MYGRWHIPLPYLAHVTCTKKKAAPHFKSSVSAPDIHIDLSIREEIESVSEAVEEGRRDIKPKTSDSV